MDFGFDLGVANKAFNLACNWWVQASVLLLHWRSYRWACNLWVLIIYLFFLPVMLPSVVPRLATDLAVRVFPGVWKLLSFLRLPSQDGSPSLPLLSLFYIFSYFLSKTMGCFFGCLTSSASIQKLFCGIYSAFKCSFVEFVGRNWSPCPIPLPS